MAIGLYLMTGGGITSHEVIPSEPSVLLPHARRREVNGGGRRSSSKTIFPHDVVVRIGR